MSGSIPKDFITEIVDMTDIVSLVESYLPLKKKGKDHFGQCPFCDDGKNPSFSVSDQKQFYYCFKCRACLLYTSPSPRDKRQSRMPSSA